MKNGKPPYQNSRLQWGTFGHDPLYDKFNHELFRAAAYLTLKPTARLILRDMIGHYMRATSYDSVEVTKKTTFRFAFGDCREPVKRTAFYASIRDIIQHGFFEPDETYAPGKGEQARFRASTNWRNYQPGQREICELTDYAERRITTTSQPNPDVESIVAYLPAILDRAKRGQLFDPGDARRARITQRFLQEENR